MAKISLSQSKSRNQLLNFIFNLSGSKIVTFSNESTHKRFDLSADNTVGYENYHLFLFNKLVNETICSHGSIIIRQFTNLTYSVLDDGTTIPYKNIYGFYSDGSKLFPIDKGDLKESFVVDREGNKLALIEGDLFCDQSDLSSHPFHYSSTNYCHKIFQSKIDKTDIIRSMTNFESNDKILSKISLNNISDGIEVFPMEKIESFIPFVIFEFCAWVLRDGSWEYDYDNYELVRLESGHDYSEYFQVSLKYWIENYIVNINKDGTYSSSNPSDIAEAETFESSINWVLSEFYNMEDPSLSANQVSSLLRLHDHNLQSIMEALYKLDPMSLFFQYSDYFLETNELHLLINE